MDIAQPRHLPSSRRMSSPRSLLLYGMIIWSRTAMVTSALNLTVGSTGFRTTLPPLSTPATTPAMTNTNILHVPITNSTLPAPEVSSTCPEYCVCSQLEGLLTCNGQHIFPMPNRFLGFNISRVLLENFKKNDLRPADLVLVGPPTGLRELRLPRNSITSLKTGLFTPLKGSFADLKRLDLSGNKLSMVGNLTFIGLARLTTLDLSSNRIATIDALSFAYLLDLIQLDLSFNKLTQLPSDLFTGLTALQYLNLEVNQIVQLHPRVLVPLRALVHLNLAMNPALDSALLEIVGFGELIHLQYCDLSHCSLRQVPQNLPFTIRDIRLTGNRLDTLTKESFAKYPALAVLVMDDCNITHVATDVFDNLTSLQRLWMNGNGLRKVPARLPASLKGLYLDENNISFLERLDLARLVDMEEIRLQRNQITTIESGAFAAMPRLDVCDLRGNRLQTLNTALFPPVNSISRLDLSLNPLRVLGTDFFQHLSSLKQLDMSRLHTLTTNWPDTFFAMLPHLTALDLSGSPVLAEKFLSMAAGQNVSIFLRHLHSLNLRGCELASFDGSLSPLFSRIAKIKLTQNEFGCFAENRWLYHMIQTDQKRFYRAQELKCFSPKHLKDRKIIALDTTSLEMRHVPTTTSTTTSPEIDYYGHLLSIPRNMSPNEESSTTLTEEKSRSWVVTFIACLLTASVVSLLFVVSMSCCNAERVRAKRLSICSKISSILGFKQDPYPDLMAASNRTLYRSQDDSIFMIGTDTPYPHLSAYEELEQRTIRRNFEGIYENDGLSTISTLRSSLEIRV